MTTKAEGLAQRAEEAGYRLDRRVAQQWDGRHAASGGATSRLRTSWDHRERCWKLYKDGQVAPVMLDATFREVEAYLAAGGRV